MRPVLVCGVLVAAASCADVASSAEPRLRAASPAAPSPSASPATRLQKGRELLGRSAYAEAERELRAALAGPTRRAAQLALAELLLLTGRYEEAEHVADDARADPAARADAAVLKAEALRRLGRAPEAIALLRTVEREPEARGARLLLGELLVERSAPPAESAPPLLAIIDDYNQGRLPKGQALPLAQVGRAAHLLRSPEDANDAYNEAERAQRGHLPTLLYRAELFLEKYDPGHAEEVLREALKVAPDHPVAQVLMAEVRLAQALDFGAAEAHARRALAVNPRLAAAHFVLAGIALRDLDFEEADAHLDRGLATNPRDLLLLSMKAAVRFLADDTAGFARVRAQVLAESPRYTRFHQVVGDYADWEHRYEELSALMREALALEPRDARARGQLGLNLIRLGEETEALAELDRAFREDRFNVRVFNTLNLYEKQVPAGYVTVEEGQFRFRFPRDDAALLRRYVPALAREAWKRFVADYGMTPAAPVGIELWSTREAFSVRTSGLPGGAIQGVCFGRTLATLSPRAEPFNLGMTLWHELAHVFHIQASRSRVPRWFTEGLAEHETRVRRPEWKRELDRELYEALRAGTLPPLASMNRAFTRAEELADVAMAYQASSEVIAFFVERFGRGKLVELLGAWSRGERTPQVLERVLGSSPEALDGAFRSWLGERLARYRRQFVPLTRSGAADRLEQEARARPGDATLQVKLALARLRRGDRQGAEAALARAAALEPEDPQVLWLGIQLALLRKDRAEAAARLERFRAAGHDGFEVQMLVADLARAAGDDAGLARALESAHRHDPTHAAPLVGLAGLAERRKDAAAELGWVKALAGLEEHDPRPHRRLVRLLLDQGRVPEALEAAETGLWADLLGLEMHALFGEALLAADRVPRALFEFESALLAGGRPAELARVHRLMAKAYAKVPNLPKARHHEAEARKLE